MTRQFVIIFILISVALGAIYFRVGVETLLREPDRVARDVSLHHAVDTDQSLEHIHVTAFYFVPRNKQTTRLGNWKILLDEQLQNLRRFHTVQFQGHSNITYTIYPEPVIGVQESLWYDTEDTQYGNPSGLRNVAHELERRFFDPRGDLHQSALVSPHDGAYDVTYILYEGVGAAGSEDVAFLSSTFISRDEYRDIQGPTFFAHEFYHTLGLDDAYDLTTGIAEAGDIMGLGRFKPLDQTYMRKESRMQLGF